MSIDITGVVTNGVIIPNARLPEGTRVAIHPQPSLGDSSSERLTPSELRQLPREQRQAILAAAAALAERDYRENKELTGFEAFSEEELNVDESDTH